MRKTVAYVLYGVLLIVGLGLGHGGATVLGPSGAGKVHNARLRVGHQAPGFRLPDRTGGYVELSDYLGKRNVVIAFYPLAWTPV